MSKNFINNPFYLNTWFENLENFSAIERDIETFSFWQKVVLIQTNTIDNDLYTLLKSKITILRSQLGEDFNLSLLSSLGILPEIIQESKKLKQDWSKLNNERQSTENMKKLLTIYIQCVQGPFNSELGILNSIISFRDRKNYFQRTLFPAIQFLSSAQNDYSAFTNLADPQIRNSYDHHGVEYKDNHFVFTYYIGKNIKTKFMDYYSFKLQLEQLILGIMTFYALLVETISNQKLLNTELIQYCYPEQRYGWLEMFISTPKVECTNTELVTIINEKKQLNISFESFDVSKENRVWFMTQSAALAALFLHEIDIHFDRIFVNIKSPKTLPSFIVFLADNLNLYIAEKMSYQKVIETDQCIWDVNNDTSPIQKIVFENINLDVEGAYITQIEDISTPTAKVFKAVLVAPEVLNVKQAQNISRIAIETVKKLPNGGDRAFRTKHGTFPADRIYIVIYKDFSKPKHLYNENSNFLASVQYDAKKEFPINKHNGLLSPLKRMVIENVEYRWNSAFYESSNT